MTHHFKKFSIQYYFLYQNNEFPRLDPMKIDDNVSDFLFSHSLCSVNDSYDISTDSDYHGLIDFSRILH